MKIQLLADCPEVIPAIACLHQLEMKLGVESIAKKIGYQQLYLYTWSAEKYYHQLDWVALDTVQPLERPISVIMQKNLQ